jgi:hypothetical protein
VPGIKLPSLLLCQDGADGAPAIIRPVVVGPVVTRGLGHIVASRKYLEVAWADACTAFGESAKVFTGARSVWLKFLIAEGESVCDGGAREDERLVADFRKGRHESVRFIRIKWIYHPTTSQLPSMTTKKLREEGRFIGRLA